MNPSRREQLRALYGFDFPDDLFRFWQFVNRLQPLEPLYALGEELGVTLVGPPPERFGVSIRRCGADSYSVRLLWDRTYLTWGDLPRAQILTSALAPLLGAMGTDLWYLLDQPVKSAAAYDRAA